MRLVEFCPIPISGNPNDEVASEEWWVAGAKIC